MSSLLLNYLVYTFLLGNRLLEPTSAIKLRRRSFGIASTSLFEQVHDGGGNNVSDNCVLLCSVVELLYLS